MALRRQRQPSRRVQTPRPAKPSRRVAPKKGLTRDNKITNRLVRQGKLPKSQMERTPQRKPVKRKPKANLGGFLKKPIDKKFVGITKKKKAKKKPSVLDQNTEKFVKGVRKAAKPVIKSVRKGLTGGKSTSAKNLKKFGGQVFKKAHKGFNKAVRLKARAKKIFKKK